MIRTLATLCTLVWTLSLACGFARAQQPDPTPDLIAALKGSSPSKLKAAFELGRLGGKAESAIPALVELLGDADPQVRVAAIESLVQIRREPKLVSPALVKTLGDTSPEVRVAAATALGNLRWEAEQTVPALIAALKDASPIVRARAAIGLSFGDVKKYPNAAAAALPVLVDATKTATMQIRAEAAAALGRVAGDQPDAAVPALVACLADPEPQVRMNAIGGLAQLGPKAQAALPALKELLADNAPAVSARAPRAIVTIDPEKGPATLVAALKDKNPLVRAAVAEGLGEMPRSEESVAALAGALKDRDREVRYRAVRSLVRMGMAAKPAVADLTLVLTGDNNYLIRTAAAEALGQIGPDAAAATPALVAALGDWNAGVRRAAETAIAKINPAPAAKK